MYKSLLIANYLVDKGIQEKHFITPMQVIKLTYISHGYYLAFTGNPLLDENPEAWQYGPVIVSVYDAFKCYGRNPITQLHKDVGGNLFDFSLIKSNDKDIIDAVWENYKEFDGIRLSYLTHQNNTPWYITWNNGTSKNRRRSQISDTLIEEHYKNILHDRTNSNK